MKDQKKSSKLFIAMNGFLYEKHYDSKYELLENTSREKTVALIIQNQLRDLAYRFPQLGTV